MNLKEKLINNELTIGSWLSFGYTPLTEMMCTIGFEWLVIDMEHTSISSQEALQMMQIISANNITPLIRVGENSELIIKKANFKIKLVQPQNNSFTSTIRHKLMWGLDKRS